MDYKELFTTLVFTKEQLLAVANLAEAGEKIPLCALLAFSEDGRTPRISEDDIGWLAPCPPLGNIKVLTTR